MQSLDLNLASRPFRNNTLLWVGYGAAVVALIAGSVWSVQTYRTHNAWLVDFRRQVGDLDRRFGELDRRDRVARRGISRFDLTSLEVQATKANDVIRWKAFSWTELFNAMEQILPHGVKMTSVHPMFRATRRRGPRTETQKKGMVPVAVEGIARDLRSFLELERALLASNRFDRVEPERTELDDVSGETVFRLRFNYDSQIDRVAPTPPAGEPPADAAAPVEPEPSDDPPTEPTADAVVAAAREEGER